ncbi:EAL domain-containing protein [bacterium]|nr:MAG: EAL domain-containing protein [bacterium]
MDTYIIVLQMQDNDIFEGIYGFNVIVETQKDIAEGFRDIAIALLEQYDIQSDVCSPSFGIWYILFSPRKTALPVDFKEQFSSLTITGNHLIRAMLQKDLGMATGTFIDFKLAIFSQPGSVQSPEVLNTFIRDNLTDVSSVGCPYADVQKDEVTTIINTKGMELFLLPIISLIDESIVGYEILSRGPMNSPMRDPANLFGTALHFGLREELEVACIAKILSLIRKIPAHYFIAINISPDLISRPAFNEIINQEEQKDLLSRVVFEITEHLPIQTSGELLNSIHLLKGMGIRLALDDTGCGFAHLDTVRMLRPHFVKLCITVTRLLGRNPEIEKDIQKTVDIIQELDGEVVGEGVERKEQAEILKNNNVSYAQGYYYSHPKPFSEFFP